MIRFMVSFVKGVKSLPDPGPEIIGRHVFSTGYHRGQFVPADPGQHLGV